MSHVSMIHVTHMNESCHTYELITNSYTLAQGPHDGVAGGGVQTHRHVTQINQ